MNNPFNKRLTNFRGSVANWREYVNSLDTSNPLTARVVNDQIRYTGCPNKQGNSGMIKEIFYIK